MIQRLDGRGAWDCIRCGVYVGVKGNPLDARDPRPLCYDCAVRERDGREHAQRTREAAARGVPAALRELARLAKEDYDAMREPEPDPDPDPDPDDGWDSLFVELPTSEGAPAPGAKLIVKGSYGVSYLLTVERVVRGRPLRHAQGATTEWEIKGTRRPLIPGE